MANYINFKGTLAKSFKFGPNGISLQTKSIIDPTGNVKKSLIRTDILSANNRNLRVVFEDENEPIAERFNSYIASTDIEKIETLQSGGIKIYLKDWQARNVPEYIEILSNPAVDVSDKVSGPNSAVDGNIAVFDGTTGKKIKDSSYSISADSDISQLIEYDYENSEIIVDNSTISTIPTTAAVLNYIGYLDEAIKRRLDGEL